jgi:hypothetical protein
MDTDQDENVMDDFSSLTFREPWLLKKISASTASTWLAAKELMLWGRRDLRQETKSMVLNQLDFPEERKTSERVQFLVRR